MRVDKQRPHSGRVFRKGRATLDLRLSTTEAGMPELARLKPHFLSAWVRNPLQMGAILPSSSQLARSMAAQLGDTSGLVVELGAGTGAVTAALLARGIPLDRLIVVERHHALARELAARFPKLSVLSGDAGRLRKLIGGQLTMPVDAVVSSLPLLSMRSVTRTRALSQAFDILKPGGKFVQFTYGPRPPIPDSTARALGVEGERTVRVLRNLPPAAVWIYRRH
jgi:phosphatidylethanolamine/phosphatidyl-N-methylethanolamine N-methyltransferase